MEKEKPHVNNLIGLFHNAINGAMNDDDISSDDTAEKMAVLAESYLTFYHFLFTDENGNKKE